MSSNFEPDGTIFEGGTCTVKMIGADNSVSLAAASVV
jgi:hypothetical protein